MNDDEETLYVRDPSDTAAAVLRPEPIRPVCTEECCVEQSIIAPDYCTLKRCKLLKQQRDAARSSAAAKNAFRCNTTTPCNPADKVKEQPPQCTVPCVEKALTPRQKNQLEADRTVCDTPADECIRLINNDERKQANQLAVKDEKGTKDGCTRKQCGEEAKPKSNKKKNKDGGKQQKCEDLAIYAL